MSAPESEAPAAAPKTKATSTSSQAGEESTLLDRVLTGVAGFLVLVIVYQLSGGIADRLPPSSKPTGSAAQATASTSRGQEGGGSASGLSGGPSGPAGGPSGPGGGPGGQARGGPAPMGGSVMAHQITEISELTSALLAMEQLKQPLNAQQATQMAALIDEHISLTQKISHLLNSVVPLMTLEQQTVFRQPPVFPPPGVAPEPGSDPVLDAAYRSLKTKASAPADPKAPASNPAGGTTTLIPTHPTAVYSALYSLTIRPELHLTAPQAKKFVEILEQVRDLRKQRLALLTRMVSSLTPQQAEILSSQRTMTYLECGESWLLGHFLRSKK